MKLTPLDVRKQEFRKTLRGFDPIEVQTFLEMVAEEYERVLDENKQLNRKQIESETKLKDFQETEKNLRETLLNVQEVKKQSEESSRRQADLIIKESELKALEIIEKARQQARKMRDEVNTLRTQKESFINRLRQILISQIELLSVLEVDDAIPEEAIEFVNRAKAAKKKKLLRKTDELKVQSIGSAEDVNVDSKNQEPELLESDIKEEEEDTFTISADFIESDQAEEVEQKKIKSTEEVSEKKEKKLEDEDINEFFKKGIQIDELIQNLDKKQTK